LHITLNGDPHDVAGPLTIGDLLAQLKIDARRVAVEHNLVVLKRDAYATTAVHDGDEIEIVNFVGGGAGIKNQEFGIKNLELRIGTTQNRG
jgi:thiamine biosynthesis protein ThiS